jgi:hypothetical protein
VIGCFDELDDQKAGVWQTFDAVDRDDVMMIERGDQAHRSVA